MNAHLVYYRVHSVICHIHRRMVVCWGGLRDTSEATWVWHVDGGGCMWGGCLYHVGTFGKGR